MKLAIKLAKKGLGRTSPNPAVGAVIIRGDKVIASGYHKKAGGNHAEIEALSMIGGKGEADDIMYVTLEPCNHYGRTPPCTKAILQSGIKNVVIGMLDPNPGVEGKGADYLSHNGIKITTGVMKPECERINETYIKYITTKMPFIIAKSAVTMDGWSATSTGHSKWITNERSRGFVHKLRDKADAVLVGVGTVIKDNPSLTTRLKNKRGKDPVRIIVDTNLRIPHNVKVLNHDSDSSTILIVGDHVSSEELKKIEKKGVDIIKCGVREGKVDLTDMAERVGKRYLTSILVEGGSSIMGSMIRDKLIDKFYIFKAPRIYGGNDGYPMARGKGPENMNETLGIKDIKVRHFGDDILIRGYADYLPGN